MDKSILRSVYKVINEVAITKVHCKIEVQEALTHLLSEVSRRNDFSTVTKEELELLGFKSWKVDNNTDIMLIPIYIFPILPSGTEVVSVNGQRRVVGVDYIDNDVCGGFIAYGLTIDHRN